MKYSFLLFFSFLCWNTNAQCVINKNNLEYLPEFSDEFNYTSYETLQKKWFLERKNSLNEPNRVRTHSPGFIHSGDNTEKTKTHILNGKTISLRALKLPTIQWVDVDQKKDKLVEYGRNETKNKSDYVSGKGYAFHEKNNSTDCQIPIEYRTGNLQLKAYPFQNEINVIGSPCWSPAGTSKRGLTYGYYEIRMRVKGLENMFAFWLFSAPDEIDIYESTGFESTGHNYGYTFGQHVYPWGTYNSNVFSHYWDERIPYTTKPNGEVLRSVINAFEKNEIRNVGDEDWVVVGLLYTKEFWGVYINDHEVGRVYDHHTIGCPMDVLLDVYVNSDRLSDEMLNEDVLYEWEIDYFRYYKIKNEKEIFAPKWMIGLVAEKEEKITSKYKPQINDDGLILQPYIGVDQLVEGISNTSEHNRHIFYVGENNWIYNLYYNKNGWHNSSLTSNYLKEEQCAGDIISCKNSSGANQIFYENIDGWIATYYWNKEIKSWKHSYLTTDWDINETCGGDIKINSQTNQIFYRNKNNWIATYLWNNTTKIWDHDVLTKNRSNPEEEQCFGDIAVGDKHVFYRNKAGRIAAYQWDEIGNTWKHKIISNGSPEKMCSEDGDIVSAGNKLFFKNINESIVGYIFESDISNKTFINLNPLSLEEQKCRQSLNVGRQGNIYFVNSEGMFCNYYWKDNKYKFSKISVSSYFDSYNNIYPIKDNIFRGNDRLYYVNENGDLATLSYGGNYCEGTQSEWGFYDYEFWNDPDYLISYIDHSNDFPYTVCDDIFYHTGNIGSGTFHINGPIIATGIITSPAIIQFYSNEYISFEAGFESQYGAELDAVIEKCE